jgi:hypothetical protein
VSPTWLFCKKQLPKSTFDKPGSSYKVTKSCKKVDDKPKDLIKSMEYDVLVELKFQLPPLAFGSL